MIIRPMTLQDLDAVMTIENDVYVDSWSRSSYEQELKSNEFAYLFVLEERNNIIGYYGFWLVSDYMTITKATVHRGLWGYGFGKCIMQDLESRAVKADVATIDLEVRASNERAINLYKGAGFVPVNLRKNYYPNGEDAILMIKTMKEGKNYERVHIGN